jgi:hypothetical protein
MRDLDQIKQGEQGARDRHGRFPKGRSGNPACRPRGGRNHIKSAGYERGSGMRFAADSLQISARTAGAARNRRSAGLPPASLVSPLGSR